MSKEIRLSRDQIVAELFEEARAGQNASDAVDEAAAELLGINTTDNRCLDILERNERMTAGELATAAGLTTGAITTAIDRLERAGYVQRLRDADDRRKVVVALTPLTRRKAVELYGPLMESAQAIAARYSTEELAIIRDFLRLGRELNEEHAVRLREKAARARRK